MPFHPVLPSDVADETSSVYVSPVGRPGDESGCSGWPMGCAWAWVSDRNASWRAVLAERTIDVL